MKLVHWLLMGGLLRCIWYSEEWPRWAAAPPSPLLPVTAHPSTASVPVTILLCNGLLLCGFNVPTKGLVKTSDLE